MGQPAVLVERELHKRKPACCRVAEHRRPVVVGAHKVGCLLHRLAQKAGDASLERVALPGQQLGLKFAPRQHHAREPSLPWRLYGPLIAWLAVGDGERAS
eukprot:scaffold129387_cov26-Tisochrysis_lutea.AAC.1